MSVSVRMWLFVFCLMSLGPAAGCTDGIGGQTTIVGGLDIPLHPDAFDDGWKLGMHGILEFGVVFANRISVVGGVGYARHSLDGEQLLRQAGLNLYGVTLEGGAYSALTIAGGLNTYVIPLTCPVSPYLIARLGYMRLRIDDATVHVPGYGSLYGAGNSESAFGIQGGLGTSFNASRHLSLIFESRYSLGLASDETGSLGLYGGVTIRW